MKVQVIIILTGSQVALAQPPGTSAQQGCVRTSSLAGYQQLMINEKAHNNKPLELLKSRSLCKWINSSCRRRYLNKSIRQHQARSKGLHVQVDMLISIDCNKRPTFSTSPRTQSASGKFVLRERQHRRHCQQTARSAVA